MKDFETVLNSNKEEGSFYCAGTLGALKDGKIFEVLSKELSEVKESNSQYLHLYQETLNSLEALGLGKGQIFGIKLIGVN